MVHGLHQDVLFGAIYAVFLVVVAGILERVARQSHRLSKQIEVAGFRYHPSHDRWECPEGQFLNRDLTDSAFKIVTYRAPKHVCRACRCRELCTDSGDGRRIEHRIDSWLQSELRRFHRGISLVLFLLAGIILAAEMSGQDTSRDWVVILGVLLPIASFGTRHLIAFLDLNSERTQRSSQE